MELPETTKDITIAWLNEVLHENGFLGRANIVSLKHEQIGVGQGFMSDTAKLMVTFDREAPHLPKTMVAKLPPSRQSAREAVMRLNLFEREIRFYIEVAPKSPIRTPGLIYGAMNSEKQKYVLLMDDCSHCTPGDQLLGLTYQQTKIVVSKIADFHARWWSDENPVSFPWMPKYKDDMRVRINGFRSAWDACAQSEDFRKTLTEGGWEAGLKIIEQLPWLVRNVPEDNLTINQFDLKADNMFFDWDTPGDPLILFDLAPACIGRGVTDLARLFGSSLTTELRRQVEKEMVQLYYERLLARGVSGYTFNECWTDYLRGLLLLAGLPVTIYSRIDHSEPRGLKVVGLTLNRWFTAILDNEATSILP